jgi:hypothetical protein
MPVQVIPSSVVLIEEGAAILSSEVLGRRAFLEGQVKRQRECSYIISKARTSMFQGHGHYLTKSLCLLASLTLDSSRNCKVSTSPSRAASCSGLRPYCDEIEKEASHFTQKAKTEDK